MIRLVVTPEDILTGIILALLVVLVFASWLHGKYVKLRRGGVVMMVNSPPMLDQVELRGVSTSDL